MHPRYEQKFRTDTQSNSMPGVMTPRFVCKKCKRHAVAAGRVKYAGGGYKCAACAGK